MRNHGICGMHKRRRPRWKRSSGIEQAPANLVRRDFRPDAPDQTWAGDITCIPTDRGWLHLAVVLDVGSRRLIGYSMSSHTRAGLVVDALHTAAAARGHRTASVVFHSDRLNLANTRHGPSRRPASGSAYTDPQEEPATLWTTPPAESFFSTLQHELIDRHRWTTRAQARQHIALWISGWYNQHRLHSATGMVPPIECELACATDPQNQPLHN